MQQQNTVPNQHYADDPITFCHADILEIADLLPEPAVIITDPPYGISCCTKESFGAS